MALVLTLIKFLYLNIIRYDITDAKLFSNETQDLLVDYWPLPNSQVPVTKKEEKKEGNKVTYSEPGLLLFYYYNLLVLLHF